MYKSPLFCAIEPDREETIKEALKSTLKYIFQYMVNTT